MGGLGDGIGEYEGCAVYVPFTVVGDEITAEIVTQRKDEIRARLIELRKAGLGRVAPACVHFGICGGCSLQHLAADDYAAFKRGILAQILRRLGCEDALQEMVLVGAGARRRVEVKIAMEKGVVKLGFHENRSHALVDVIACPVTRGEIIALFAPLRELIAGFKKPGQVKSIQLTQVEKGFDLLLVTASRLPAEDRTRLSAFAEKHHIIRIAEQVAEGDVQVIYRKGYVTASFADTEVELPAPAFLQATEEGQAGITDFILREMQGRKRVLDLYCGCGTYSFPLQQSGSRVSAYEGSYEMVTAMQNAIRRHGLEEAMQVSQRDLFKNPVKAEEMRGFDGVVINPPRNGAESQAKQLAKSAVPKIVMISCNPATFERDAKHLLAGDYKLTSALPIDQFYWSAHLELVAAFERLL